MRWLAVLLALVLPVQVQAQGVSMADLAAQDRRLATVAERIMLGNAALCPQLMPITGITLHSADQYGAEMRGEMFPDGPLSIALVLPGSPAAAAGLRAGDVVRSIGGQAVDALPPPAEGHLREAAFEVLARQPRGTPFSLRISRDGSVSDITLTALAGCRALVEIAEGDATKAHTDGRVIQLSYDRMTGLDDNGLATVFAHELAHVVLHHRIRLEAAGVGEEDGDTRTHRRWRRMVEEEADRLSPHLLANAGYDPNIAVAYRRAAGGQRSRARLIAREIARYIPAPTTNSIPAHLLTLRDQPFAQ